MKTKTKNKTYHYSKEVTPMCNGEVIITTVMRHFTKFPKDYDSCTFSLLTEKQAYELIGDEEWESGGKESGCDFVILSSSDTE